MATKKAPNDFGKLYDACLEAKLDCQLHRYGTGKKAGLQIEIYNEKETCVAKEQVSTKEKPEAAAKRLLKQMKDAGTLG